MKPSPVFSVLLFVCALATSIAFASTTAVVVTGAGLGVFNASTSYDGVVVSSIDFGLGVEIPGDTSASGAFHATLQGSGQPIEIDGRVTSGSMLADGRASFAGNGTLDRGNGAQPTTIAFSVIVAPGAAGTAVVTLSLGSTTLAPASVQDGSVSVR
jgi:hypothetical protein